MTAPQCEKCEKTKIALHCITGRIHNQLCHVADCPAHTDRAFSDLVKKILKSVLPWCGQNVEDYFFDMDKHHVFSCGHEALACIIRHCCSVTIIPHPFIHYIFFSPEISCFHLFHLPTLHPASQSLFTRLCRCLHPLPSIFGCSSRPPANPLISSHLCLSCTISHIHQYNTNVHAHIVIHSTTQYYTTHCTVLFVFPVS